MAKLCYCIHPDKDFDLAGELVKNGGLESMSYAYVTIPVNNNVPNFLLTSMKGMLDRRIFTGTTTL